MTRFRLSFLLCFLVLGLQYASGQSLPYQTLLKGLYDSSFPVVKPEQITELTNYQVLDAREKVEFQVSHLKHAKWVGHETFTLKTVAELDKRITDLEKVFLGVAMGDFSIDLKIYRK